MLERILSIWHGEWGDEYYVSFYDHNRELCWRNVDFPECEQNLNYYCEDDNWQDILDLDDIIAKDKEDGFEVITEPKEIDKMLMARELVR